MKKKIPVITIDGPSGVGKSTLSYAISNKLKWNFLESGYLYRTIAYYITKFNIPLKEKKIIPILKNIKFNFKYINNKIKVIFENKDISKKLCSEKNSIISSKIAIFPYIRKWLLYKQRKFRKFPGLVTNGRDMGTKVFSDALIKIFLITKIKERAKRRCLELKSNGFNINFNFLLKKMKERDNRDKNRIICPLKPDKNAIIIDSTNMNFKNTLQIMLKYIYKKLKNINNKT
ncbi:Cytidylate kinase [Buchnera aphidicola (Periphyllus testudinaceus)]|uniref:(d)CMP kinase n=1 Tax=Buchnera aphidicola TaxID=9 RepID=UPI0034649312